MKKILLCSMLIVGSMMGMDGQFTDSDFDDHSQAASSSSSSSSSASTSSESSSEEYNSNFEPLQNKPFVRMSFAEVLDNIQTARLSGHQINDILAALSLASNVEDRAASKELLELRVAEARASLTEFEKNQSLIYLPKKICTNFLISFGQGAGQTAGTLFAQDLYETIKSRVAPDKEREAIKAINIQAKLNQVKSEAAHIQQETILLAMMASKVENENVIRELNKIAVTRKLTPEEMQQLADARRSNAQFDRILSNMQSAQA